MKRVAFCLCLSILAAVTFSCRKQSPSSDSVDESTSPPAALRLLVVDDPQLAGAIERHWSERSEGDLIVEEMTAAELANANPADVKADAIIYPAGMLGQLVKTNLISPIPPPTLDDPNLAWSDVFDLLRLREAAWDRKVYALPMGSPPLVFFYRTNMWADLELQLPETWEQYGEAVEQLQQARQMDGSLGAEIPIAEPLGKGWASHMLLARAAAYARHRNFLSTLFDVETMQPLIAGPPFVRAMEELAASNTNAEALQWDPHDTFELLRAGRAAAAISWLAPAHPGSAGSEKTESPSMAAIELPGGTESYDRERDTWDERPEEDIHVTLLTGTGRLASVARRSANATAAANLLVWITGKQWSSELVPHSPHVTLYRQEHLKNPQAWVDPSVVDERLAEQYAQVVAQSLTGRESVVAVRIPGREEYLAALDEAVAAVVRGDSQPADALAKAAETWESITNRLGREQQKDAYRRSLGL